MKVKTRMSKEVEEYKRLSEEYLDMVNNDPFNAVRKYEEELDLLMKKLDNAWWSMTEEERDSFRK